MRKSMIAGLVACLLLGLSACGKSGPTAPAAVSSVKDPQAAPAAEIEVCSSRSGYFIGESETFTARLKGSNGSPGPMTGGIWRSDDTGVATVNEAGLVTVLGQGWANISFTWNGLTGAKSIWGRVDIRGSWSGTYDIVTCLAWDDFLDSGFCETQKGSGLPVTLVLAGEGDTWDSLRGTITLGDRSTPFIALPLLDGSLEMEGQVVSAPYMVNVAVGCTLTPQGPKFNMYLYYTQNGLEGRAQVECRMSLSKTGS